MNTHSHRNRGWTPVILATLLCLAVSCSSTDEQAPPKLQGPMAVLFSLSGDIPMFPGGGNPFAPLGMSQHEFQSLLQKASTDPQVQEVVVHMGSPSLSWARAAEISDAISRFASSGKPITCHLETADNTLYWMAAGGCPQISISPAGSVELVGLSLETVYMKDLLDSMGITADIIHIGEFKDAAEPFLQNEMSQSSREANTAILDSWNKSFKETIAKGRKLDVKQLDALIARGPFDATAAVAEGLADRTDTLGSILSSLREKYPSGVEKSYGKEAPKPPSLMELMSLLSGEPESGREKPQPPHIAVIAAIGPIMGGGTDDLMAGMNVVDDMALVEVLDEVKDNDAVRAVVLRVDSPGGSALASDNIWEAVRRLKETKPVVVSMGDVAASGGYYIASAADEIFASKGTLTGSIGVVGGKVVLTGAMEKLGIHPEIIRTSPRSAIHSPLEVFSEDERVAVTSLMNDAYDLFLKRISTGRNLDIAQVKTVAEGRVWTGTQAKKHGLIDELGTMHDALERARKLAKSPGLPVKIHPEPKTLMELLSEGFAGGQPAALTVTKRFDAGKSALAFGSSLCKRRVLAYAPIFHELR